MDALRNDPSDVTTWNVWLDRLRERGDPRAEIADAGPGPGQTALLKAHAPGWFGQSVQVDHAGVVTVEESTGAFPRISAHFRHGHILMLRVHCAASGLESNWPGAQWMPALLERLLCQPVGCVVTELELRVAPFRWFRYEGLIEALVRAAPLPFRRIYVGDYNIDGAMVPDLPPLIEASPHLRSLTCEGQVSDLGELRHPQLRSLKLMTGGLSEPVVNSLSTADLPALEELELWFGMRRDDNNAPLDHFRHLLTHPLPSLRRLVLANCPFADALLNRLHEAHWLPQLQELGLKTPLTDLGGTNLLTHAESYAHLERLDLDRHQLSHAMVRQLRQELRDTVLRA